VEAPKPDKVEPPTKIEKPKPEVKKTESAPPAPQEDVLKEPPKPDEKVEKIPDKVFPKKEDKKDEKKPDPKKPDVKKPDPKKDKNDEKSFESLLSDLAPAEKKQQEDAEIAKKVTNAEPSPNVSRFSTVLSISELDALRQQLGQCWSIMAGAESADDLRVEVQVSVNADRTVNSAKVVDLSRYGSDTFFRAAADSALRALRNPLCTPLNLPSDKYDQWHDMTIVFDPKEMF
ncbi:MAG: energy transducer TonB, partial [Pseudomonadota bacterium]